MEPSDPSRPEGGSGSSKRRISSILKAPRKSIKLPDPEHQENKVESAKPTEKRNSRRVSFAPANDVLLFSKDVKNVSLAQSPLQEPMTSTATDTQNRVQFVVTADGIKQITGMDTLLNAPLHTSQQKDTVGVEFGEKTVMFSTDEAFMDMTHSHTINIAQDEEFLADVSMQNYQILPTAGEKTVIFSADDGFMDMTLNQTVNVPSQSAPLPIRRNPEEKSKPSSVPPVDPSFENFLASLSKKSCPSMNPTLTKTAPPTGVSFGQMNADKENRAPPSVPAVLEKTVMTRSVLYQGDDVSMDMTEVQTGRIQAVTDDDDDPFRCLFPSQEMISQFGNREKTKQKRKTLPAFSSEDLLSRRTPSSGVSLPGKQVNPESAKDKTIVFTASDNCVDMTQSHTVNINSGLFAPPSQNQDFFQTGGRMDRKNEGLSSSSLIEGFQDFLASLSKPTVSSSNPVKARVDSYAAAATERTGLQKEDTGMGAQRPSCSDNPFDFLFPTKDVCSDRVSLQSSKKTSEQKNSKEPGSFHHAGLATSIKPSLKTKVERNEVRSDYEDDCRERTVRFSVDDAAMDETRSYTVNIATDIIQKPNQDMDSLPSCGEKTVRFDANDAAMDVTKSYTVKIDTIFKPDQQQQSTCGDKTLRFTEIEAAMDVTKSYTVKIDTNLLPDLQQKSDFLPDCGDKTLRFDANEAAMDVTRSHTVKIDTNLVPELQQKSGSLPAHGDKTLRFTEIEASMDVTKSHTVKIDTNLVQELLQKELLPTYRDETLRFEANEATMDVTKSHTVKIDTNLEPDLLQKSLILPTYGDKTMRFNANEAAMDVTKSYTVKIDTNLQPDLQKKSANFQSYGDKTLRFDANEAAMDQTRSYTVKIDNTLEPDLQKKSANFRSCGDKTLRFDTNEAAMDVTKSHSVKIDTNFLPESQQKSSVLPACGDKTLRFTANEAAMDETKSFTVKIDTNLQPELKRKSVNVHSHGDKTLRFDPSEACMDVTKSHTVKIDTDFRPNLSQNNGGFPSSEDKTQRFTANEAAMDVTKSHTVNIDTNLEPQSHQNIDVVPSSGEGTIRFNADDDAMDVTQCPTVNIVSSSMSEPVLSNQGSNISPPEESSDTPAEYREVEPYQHRKRSLDPGLNNINGSLADSGISKADSQVTEDPSFSRDELKMQRNNVDAEKTAKDPANETVINEICMDMTEVQTGQIQSEACIGEPLQDLSTTQDRDPDYFRKPEMDHQNTEAAELPNSDEVKITNRPDSLDSNESDIWKEPEPPKQTCSFPQKTQSPPLVVDQDEDAAPSRKSRQKSIAHLHTKLRRLSHLINAAPDAVTAESCAAPPPVPEHNVETSLKDEAEALPAMEPESGENAQEQCQMQEEQPSTNASFNLKTKQLISRISVGGFKAKLPQRPRADDSKKVTSVGENTKTMTVNVTNQLSSFDADVSDILDEELGSCEDMSETIYTRTPQKTKEKGSLCQESSLDEPQEDDVFAEDFIRNCGSKRTLQEDENEEEGEKRMKTSTEMFADAEEFQPHEDVDIAVESDGNITAARSTDLSNTSHTASRCEATFESTFKHSLFESQLEEYATDVTKKFDDGSITVLEFLKLFNIDFVIHNPRQSVLPGRLLSETDRTPMDLLKDRHINRPKRTVYENNVQDLVEKVEGLKGRMRDLDKPLKIVNRALWEEIRNTTEKDLKSFGAKLKERNNFFRKTSKVKSHEMKEVLYSALKQANLEEQQKVRGKIKKADEMIKNLDDCIHELETEVAAIVEKGTDSTPSLKSIQEALQKVTEELADKDRQTAELEMQKTQDLSKLERLKAETRNLESHVDMLNILHEWRLGRQTEDSRVYTFLHDTFHLELLYEKSPENDAENHSEKKISKINFNLQLDVEKSRDHACLVHKLLSLHIDGRADWVEKYPTSTHVPKLLHDVSLVVSCCRLLGEELRLLKMWGGLKLNIWNISCVDTQVQIVFISLKNLSKFEVIFSVSLSSQHYVLQLQSFKNMFGNTTAEQIEEIVASISPTKKLLTKTVKKIHENLLC